MTLDGVTSDQAWTISLDQPRIDVPGTAVVSVPVTILVPPHASADIPVRITIRASEATGGQATGFKDIIPMLGVAPVTR